MKKRLALLIALVLTVVAVLPLITACEQDKTVTALRFVDPKTEYNVNDTIDYDSLEVEITYDDQTKERQTVAELKAKGATFKTANLSVAGPTYYAISYQGVTGRVDITVKTSQGTVTDYYTVTFKYHDNKTSDTTAQVEKNATLGNDLPAPQRTGYTFLGWYTTESDGGVKWNADTPVQGNTTLHARWQEDVVDQATVTYLWNDGTHQDPYHTLKVNKGTALASHPADPTRDDFTFDGWFTEAENGTEWDLETVVDDDLTLYAHWTAGGGQQTTQFTVTLKFEDNATSDQLIVVNEGETLGNKLPTPSRTDYTFEGWFTQQNGAGEQWTSDKPVTSNQTLYAHWQEVVRTQYTVTFVYHDNKTDDLEVEIYEDSAVGNAWPQDPEWLYHEFLGWFTLEQGGDKKDSTMVVSGDVTLHAHWNTLQEPPEVSSFLPSKGYQTYRANSTRTTEEGRADFRVLNLPYEVGNVNPFFFEPEVAATVQGGQSETIQNPVVNAKIYSKDDVGGEYTLLQGDELSAIVTKTGNKYTFTDEAADKYIKMELSLDTSVYDIEPKANLVTVEFKVVGNAYNVYNQTGLSVMADLEKRAWSEIWGCDTQIEGNTVKVIPNDKSLRFEWDDDFLCNYVDKIDWVILHNDIELDPDNMPSLYFWTKDEKGQAKKETSVLYDEATNNLKGSDAAAPFANKLVGTLRDGANMTGDLRYTDANYCRVMDVNRVDYNGVQIQGNHGVETDIGLNMAKGLFTTKRVSVSGNYQSITYTKHIDTDDDSSERSELGRLLVSYSDYDGPGTAVNDPVSHWNVFQMIQSRIKGAEKRSFAIKNLGFAGNNSVNDVSSSNFHYAGLMMSSSYTADISYSNVYASDFYVNVVQDNYGDFTFVDDKFDESGEAVNSIVNIDSCKFYDAYSNMNYMWRGHVKVQNSEMIGSGGPIFIMCDAEHTDHAGATGATTPNSTDYNKSDVGGPQLEIDTKSKFQAFATGNESWYGIYNATPLFTTIKSQLDAGLMQPQLGKTVTFSNEKGSGYVNVIAVIIPDPGLILNGKEYEDEKEKLDVRGVVTQTDDSGAVVNHFAMHNNFVTTARRFASGNAAKYPMYLESGNANVIYDANATGYGALWNASTVELEAKNGLFNILSKQTVPAYYGMQAMLNGDISRMYPNAAADREKYQTQATFSQANKDAWTNEKSELVCLYLSAGAIDPKPANAPYFGIVLQIGNYSAS